MALKPARVALVAGASGGIGKAVAHRLGADGSIVYLGYNQNQATAEEAALDVRESGGKAFALALNLLDSDRIDTVCSEIYRETGSLDILVNCAAINREMPALAMGDDVWREVMEINLDGAFKLARSAARYMMLGRWGRIVNISSIAAARGGRGQINYAAAKSALETMTRVLALEIGRKGVLVNCVAPGIIETRMSARVRREYEKEILNHVSVKRFGLPNEIASVAAFLASEDAGYINGQTIRVDGGLLL